MQRESCKSPGLVEEGLRKGRRKTAEAQHDPRWVEKQTVEGPRRNEMVQFPFPWTQCTPDRGPGLLYNTVSTLSCELLTKGQACSVVAIALDPVYS